MLRRSFSKLSASFPALSGFAATADRVTPVKSSFRPPLSDNEVVQDVKLDGGLFFFLLTPRIPSSARILCTSLSGTPQWARDLPSHSYVGVARRSNGLLMLPRFVRRGPALGPVVDEFSESGDLIRTVVCRPRQKLGTLVSPETRSWCSTGRGICTRSHLRARSRRRSWPGWVRYARHGCSFDRTARRW